MLLLLSTDSSHLRIKELLMQEQQLLHRQEEMAEAQQFRERTPLQVVPPLQEQTVFQQNQQALLTLDPRHGQPTAPD